MPASIDTPRSTLFWRSMGCPTSPDLDGGPRPGVRPASEIRDHSALLEADLGLGRREADLLRAVAFLYNDQHDEAHDLVQDLSCPEGCLLHAVLHRREPDYWNAKYWFRRCSDHPVYAALTRRLPSLAGTGAAEQALVRRLTLSGNLDPMALVDECEAAARRPGSAEEDLLRRIQQAEFEEIAAHLLA